MTTEQCRRWLEQALALTEPVGIGQFVESAARAGDFEIAERALAILEGPAREVARMRIAAPRYDQHGLAAVEQMPATHLGWPLRRAAHLGRLDDVRALAKRVSPEVLESCVWEMSAAGMNDATLQAALQWAVESAVPTLRIAEEATRRGLRSQVVPLVAAVPTCAAKIQHAIARGLEDVGEALEFAATVPEARDELLADAAELLLIKDPGQADKWLAHVRNRDARQRIEAAVVLGRARLGDPLCVEQVRAIAGREQFRQLLAAFSGYLKGGHIALAEACLAFTDSAQRTLRKGLIAGAAAAADDSATLARMLEDLKGSAHGEVCDEVVRSLGSKERWDEAEEFARRHKARTTFAPPFLAWGRARDPAFDRVESIVTWAKAQTRSSTLQAAALGATGIDPWREPYP